MSAVACSAAYGAEKALSVDETWPRTDGRFECKLAFVCYFT